MTDTATGRARGRPKTGHAKSGRARQAESVQRKREDRQHMAILLRVLAQMEPTVRRYFDAELIEVVRRSLPVEMRSHTSWISSVTEMQPTGEAGADDVPLR